MFLQEKGLLDPTLTQVMEYDVSNNLEYLAEASVGADVTKPVWRARKFTYDGSNNLLRVEYADGNDNFDNTADTLSSLTYS